MSKGLVVVTGATGFLGLHLTRRLLSGQMEVVAVCRRAGKARSLLPRSVSVIETDLTSPGSAKKRLAGLRPQAVFHLAATVNTSLAPEVALDCLSNNILGVWNALDLWAKPSLKRFVFVSSTEIYGTSAKPCREDTTPAPSSAYGVSKLAGEHLVRLAADQRGSPYTIVRISNCYGPGQNSDRLIAALIRCAATGRTLEVVSERMRRDYLFVTDAVEGLCRSLRPAAAGQTLNLAGGVSYDVKDIGAKVGAILGRPVRLRAGRRSGVDVSCAVNHGMARKLLGWKPQISLQEGLVLTINNVIDE